MIELLHGMCGSFFVGAIDNPHFLRYTNIMFENSQEDMYGGTAESIG